MNSSFILEIERPDISAHAIGNTGIPYAWTFASPTPGPHVAVTSIVHGNEFSGAIILDELLQAKLRPRRGTLSFVFCNLAAFERFDPDFPSDSRFVDEDFNRVWSPETLDGPRESVELTRAREIRPLIESVDLLLDLHTMTQPSPPLMMAGPMAKGRALAQLVGTPAHVISDKGHGNGTRMRDYGAFIDPNSARNALLLEAGQHWAASSVDVARQATARFLVAAGAIDVADLPFPLAPLPAEQSLMQVAEVVVCKTEEFKFVREFFGLEELSKGDLLATDGEQEIRIPFDECRLIMPSRKLKPGLTAVRLAQPVSASE